MTSCDFFKRYLSIKEKIRSVAQDACRDLEEIALITVSKNASLDQMIRLIEGGCFSFGESRVQEAEDKMSCLSSNISWHLIGSLQKNKINKVLGKFDLIHSVDEPKLAREIAQRSRERGLKTSILLQVNTSGEKSKKGLSVLKWEEEIPSLLQLDSLSIEGLMTLAPRTEDKQMIRECFSALYQFREKLRCDYPKCVWKHLSMGMSQDYEIAIEQGATLLRIGRSIFS